LEKREREGVEEGLGGRKRRKDRGLLAKPSSPSSLRFRTEGGNWGRPAGRLRRLPASRGSTAAGHRGKRKRAARAIYSGAHLGWGGLRTWLRGKGRPAVEVVGSGADGGGGGALGCCWRLENGVGSGEKVVPAFYRRRRSVRGGDISGGEVAGGARAASRCPAGFCGGRR
jgi:hypothetical protein